MRSGLWKEGGGARSIRRSRRRKASRPSGAAAATTSGRSAAGAGRSSEVVARRASATAGECASASQQQEEETRAPSGSPWQCPIDMPGISAIAGPAVLETFSEFRSQTQPRPSEATSPTRAKRVAKRRAERRTAGVFHGGAAAVQKTAARGGSRAVRPLGAGARRIPRPIDPSRGRERNFEAQLPPRRRRA